MFAANATEATNDFRAKYFLYIKFPTIEYNNDCYFEIHQIPVSPNATQSL